MEDITLNLVSIVIHSVALVCIVIFVLWLRPKLSAVDTLVNIYKGFTTDYEKWKKQHDDEYARLEEQLSSIKDDYAKYQDTMMTQELATKVQFTVNNVTRSVDNMKAFVSILEILEKTLEEQTTDSSSWIEVALRANRVLKSLKVIKTKYVELIKEGENFIAELVKRNKKK